AKSRGKTATVARKGSKSAPVQVASASKGKSGKGTAAKSAATVHTAGMLGGGKAPANAKTAAKPAVKGTAAVAKKTNSSGSAAKKNGNTSGSKKKSNQAAGASVRLAKRGG
ncbi:MAG: hypothetical protein WHT07_05595, partial [Desulfobaccales bacterium]